MVFGFTYVPGEPHVTVIVMRHQLLSCVNRAGCRVQQSSKSRDL